MSQDAKSTTDTSKMDDKTLKQELTARGLPTHGLKLALIERLEQAIQQEAHNKNSKISNEAFRAVYGAAAQKVTAKEREVAVHEARAAAERKPSRSTSCLFFACLGDCCEAVPCGELKTELEAAKTELGGIQRELEAAKTELGGIQRELKDRETRLGFLPDHSDPLLPILGQLGKKAGERAACVKREWRDVVRTAKALGMYRTTVLSVAAGGCEFSNFTVFCLSTGVHA